jgi:imidazolonepropionase-like amidohydrolase
MPIYHIRIPVMLKKSLLVLTVCLAPELTGAQQQATLIKGAKVFDGAAMIGTRDVLIRDGRIATIAATINPPVGATVVDAKGMTLLPGLIDSHTHAFGDALYQALVYGVTTEIDMFTEVNDARQKRAEQKAGNVPNRADLFSAGTLVTAPRGHGTEYGMAIPTISSADSAQAFVDARIAEGSDFIKIVYDDGAAYGASIPTVPYETLRAVIDATHKRGKLAVVHVGQASFATKAIEAGADGLVHLFTDASPDPDFGRLAAAKKAFVIPTFTVLYSITGKPGAGDLFADSSLAKYLSMQGRGTIGNAFPFNPRGPKRTVDGANEAVRQLLAARVPVLAGTDAPNPGTAHGIAMHKELEYLTNAGLTNVQALAAATSVPARTFSLGDRGMISAGKRADLLLVRGDPSADIKATRAIEGVWKGGVRLDRAAFASAVAATVAAEGRPKSGPVSSFDDGTTKTTFGAGWTVTTDQMAGGKSKAEMKVVDGGASGTTKSMHVTGTIVGPLPYAWAGVMYFPGPQPMSVANLSAAKGIEFWTRGDGRTYRVMIFSQKRGNTPITRDFLAGPEWTRIVMPFAGFDGIDGSDIVGIGFTGGPAPGDISLQLDEIVLR